MAATNPLLKDLRTITGRDNAVAPGKDGGLAVDGLTPDAVVRPGSYEETASVLRYANQKGLAVIVRGGGTMMRAGNIPRRYDIALDLTRLDTVVEHEPADLTVTCQAGITLGALRKHMAAAGQLVPFDPSLPDEATVGGVLAAGACGPSRTAYGVPRDFTIGMRVVTGDGRITRTGGKVVKNVAGYDLCKLYIGSLGTLGVIVEATFKVVPMPKAEREIALGFDSAADACAFAAEVYRRGLCLRAAQLLNAASAFDAERATGEAYLLALDLAGAPAAVDRSSREISEMARTSEAFAFEDRKVKPSAQPVATALVCRESTLPSRLPALIAASESIGAAPRIAADPITGVLRASWPDETDVESALAKLRDAASRAGASLTIESCPLELKRQIDVFGDPPSSFPLMRRIKEQFDPNGVLSPGRFLGRL